MNEPPSNFNELMNYLKNTIPLDKPLIEYFFDKIDAPKEALFSQHYKLKAGQMYQGRIKALYIIFTKYELLLSTSDINKLLTIYIDEYSTTNFRDYETMYVIPMADSNYIDTLSFESLFPLLLELIPVINKDEKIIDEEASKYTMDDIQFYMDLINKNIELIEKKETPSQKIVKRKREQGNIEGEDIKEEEGEDIKEEEEGEEEKVFKKRSINTYKDIEIDFNSIKRYKSYNDVIKSIEIIVSKIDNFIMEKFNISSDRFINKLFYDNYNPISAEERDNYGPMPNLQIINQNDFDEPPFLSTDLNSQLYASNELSQLILPTDLSDMYNPLSIGTVKLQTLSSIIKQNELLKLSRVLKPLENLIKSASQSLFILFSLCLKKTSDPLLRHLRYLKIPLLHKFFLIEKPYYMTITARIKEHEYRTIAIHEFEKDIMFYPNSHIHLKVVDTLLHYNKDEFQGLTNIEKRRLVNLESGYYITIKLELKEDNIYLGETYSRFKIYSKEIVFKFRGASNFEVFDPFKSAFGTCIFTINNEKNTNDKFQIFVTTDLYDLFDKDTLFSHLMIENYIPRSQTVSILLNDHKRTRNL